MHTKRKQLLRDFLVMAFFLFIGLMVSACGEAIKAEPTQSQTPSKTATHSPTPIPTQTNTATPIPTPTITPTSTPDPRKIASGIEGLNQERTYKVDGNYLVDQFNKAPKAVKNEDGSWRKLDYTIPEDAEMMYGHLVPKGEEYILNKGGLYINMFSGSKFSKVNSRYLGDWEKELIKYGGEDINLFYLITGLRDKDDKLHIARIPLDAPDYQAPHGVLYICRIGTMELDARPVTLFHLFEQMKIGEKVGVPIYIKDKVIVPPLFRAAENDYPESSSIQSVMITELFLQRPDWKMSSEEKKLIQKMQWPDRVVTLGIPDRIKSEVIPVAPVLYRNDMYKCPNWLPSE